MATTQYIGSRYVPLFADPAEWNNTRAYEPLTIVLHEGNSYTSKQYVPKGIDISNVAFWAETGNYNAQVEQYRKEVLSYDERITSADTIANNAISLAQTKVPKVNTTTDFKNLDAEVGAYCQTLGYRSIGDGGQAVYIIADDSEADNVTSFQTSNGHTAVFVGMPNLRQIGCTESAKDNHTRISIALAKTKSVTIPTGNFNIYGTVNLPQTCNIEGSGFESKLIMHSNSTLFSLASLISHPHLQNFTIDMNNSTGVAIYLKNPYDNCFIKDVFIDNCAGTAIQVGDDSTSEISQTLSIENVQIYTSDTTLTKPLMLLNRLQEFLIANSKFLVRNAALNNASNLVLVDSNNSYIYGNSFTGCNVKPNIQIGDALAYNQRFFGNWFENNEAAPINMQLPNLGSASSQSFFIGDCFYYNANKKAVFKNAGTVTIIGGMDFDSNETGSSRINIENTSNQYTKTGVWKSVLNGNSKMIKSILFSALFNDNGFEILHNASENADYGLAINYNSDNLFSITPKGIFSKLYISSPDATRWRIMVDNEGNLSCSKE